MIRNRLPLRLLSDGEVLPTPQKQTFKMFHLTVLIYALISIALSSALYAQTDQPQIVTDKNQYSVGETMVISGAGFTPSVPVVITVLRPDHTTETLNTAYTNSAGAFTASYTPAEPQLPGRYTITATDGTNSAKTATTEADAIGYSKLVYNKGTPAPDDATGVWTTGNAGSNYREGQWAYYQYMITGITSTTPTFDVEFNHYQSSSNALFIDGFANFRACVDCTDFARTTGPSGLQGMLLDGVPYPPSNNGPGPSIDTTNWVVANTAVSLINHPYTSDTCQVAEDPVNTPSGDHCFHVDGAALHGLFDPNIFLSGTHTITLFYAAHLAATTTWSTGNESLLACSSAPLYYVAPFPSTMPDPTAYGTDAYGNDNCVKGDDDDWTTPFNGVGSATGSSRHFGITNQTAGSQGQLTLPIPTVPAPTGSITIVKETNPTDSGADTFDFTGDLGAFTLDTNTGDATYPNSITFSDLAGGASYEVAETAPASKWSLTNINCVNNTGTSAFNYASPSVTIDLTDTSGATVTCTFTNEAAQLIVIKHVINDNGGTKTASDFTMTINSVTTIGTNSFPGAESPGTSRYLSTVGAYTVTETELDGYAASYSTDCDGTIAFGETKTCTITNDDVGAHLKLVKIVTNDNGGTKTVNDFPLSASGPTPLTNVISGTAAADVDVDAGDYDLSETTVSGYTASAWSCVGGTQNDSTITLALGESATCTITNDDVGAHLKLVKVVTNDNGGTKTVNDFPLSASGPTPLTNVISGTAAADVDVDAGDYDLSETTVSGYTASAWSCVGGTQNDSTITLALGEGATCTITNDDVEMGTTTRTQGFWATHTELANSVWAGVAPVDASLCVTPITAIPAPGQNELMGGFWANVAKTTNSTKRSNLDKFRMQMLQQYLAAALNVYQFGAFVDLAAARTAYCGTDIDAIKIQIGVLGAFNESGDSGPFDPGVSATPRDSREQANIPFWDNTTH